MKLLHKIKKVIMYSPTLNERELKIANTIILAGLCIILFICYILYKSVQ